MTSRPRLDILATTMSRRSLLDSVRRSTTCPAQLERLASGGLEGKVLFDPTIEGSFYS